MRSFQELTEKRSIEDLTKHPYQKLLDEVYKRVNAERVANYYKPLPYGFFVKRISMIQTIYEKPSLDEKYAFLKRCQNSSNFGKCFMGGTKKKTK